MVLELRAFSGALAIAQGRLLSLHDSKKAVGAECNFNACRFSVPVPNGSFIVIWQTGLSVAAQSGHFPRFTECSFELRIGKGWEVGLGGGGGGGGAREGSRADGESGAQYHGDFYRLLSGCLGKTRLRRPRREDHFERGTETGGV